MLFLLSFKRGVSHVNRGLLSCELDGRPYRIVVMELLLFLARALPRRRQNGARAGTGQRRSHTRGAELTWKSFARGDNATRPCTCTPAQLSLAHVPRAATYDGDAIILSHARASGLSGYRVAVIRFRPEGLPVLVRTDNDRRRRDNGS